MKVFYSYVFLIIVHVIYSTNAMEASSLDNAKEYYKNAQSVMELKPLLFMADDVDNDSMSIEEDSMSIEEIEIKRRGQEFQDLFNELPEELKELVCDTVSVEALFEHAPYLQLPQISRDKIMQRCIEYFTEMFYVLKESAFKDTESSYNAYNDLAKKAWLMVRRTRHHATSFDDYGSEFSLIPVTLSKCDFEKELNRYVETTENRITFFKRNHDNNEDMQSSIEGYKIMRKDFLNLVFYALQERKLNENSKYCLRTSFKYLPSIGVFIFGVYEVGKMFIFDESRTEMQMDVVYGLVSMGCSFVGALVCMGLDGSIMDRWLSIGSYECLIANTKKKIQELETLTTDEIV